MGSVFVYGSLMSGKVLNVLLGVRAPTLTNGRMVPAVLRGFRRFAIHECVYPAILSAGSAAELVQKEAVVPVDEPVVEGLLLKDLSSDELELFDEFEDEDYTRQELVVKPGTAPSEIAFVYVWKDEAKDLLYGEWDFKHFLDQHETEYLVGVTEFKKKGGWS